MRRYMQKPLTVPFKIFTARLAELNNYLSVFPRSNEIKNMDKADINNILLLVVHNVWSKKSYLQVCGFEGKTYKDTCNMFKII